MADQRAEFLMRLELLSIASGRVVADVLSKMGLPPDMLGPRGPLNAREFSVPSAICAASAELGVPEAAFRDDMACLNACARARHVNLATLAEEPGFWTSVSRNLTPKTARHLAKVLRAFGAPRNVKDLRTAVALVARELEPGLQSWLVTAARQLDAQAEAKELASEDRPPAENT